MHDEMNEKISRLLDDDLETKDMLGLLHEIQAENPLRAKLCRYQTISQVLKGSKPCTPIKADFSHRIQQHIQQEPTYFLPQAQSQNRNNTEPTPISQTLPNNLKWWATAAAAMIAAVLVGQGLWRSPNQPVISQGTQITAMASQQQAYPPTNPQITASNKATRPPLNARFNEYLQAHNNSIYTNGEATFQPYARVATYRQE